MEGTLQLRAESFTNGGSIPRKHTCDAGLSSGTNPALVILGVPAGTISLVLVIEDPDVSVGIRPDRMFDHWVRFNIPPDTERIEEGEEPDGVPGRATSGHLGYVGPCPPDGEHRYFFKLYALDCSIDLPPGSSKEEVLDAMDGHILDQTELMGRYKRG